MVMGSATATLALKMPTTKGTDNRQIVNIALPSCPFRKTLSIPFSVRPIAGVAT
jgi:hypothetical protein